MPLPFTAEQFFDVFAQYNRAFWLAAAALWMASAAAVALAWQRPRAWSGYLSAVLGVLWIWNAAAYHALLFAHINPAAWLFAVLFAAEGALLIRVARRREPTYFSSTSMWRWIGGALAVYALGYPALSMAFVHAYPAVPTFGVPCPTVILTIGVLLATDRIPLGLTVVAIFWSAIGGSAAVLFGVTTDYLLLAAGVLLVVRVLQQRIGDASR